MGEQTCKGLGGAGRGGGTFDFLGGKAGLGDSGLGGGPDLVVLVTVVGFCVLGLNT